jgi:hypothetical protein
MTITAIGSVFGKQAYTDKGNKYQKTNTGKTVGTAAGLIAVGATALKHRDGFAVMKKYFGKIPVIAALGVGTWLAVTVGRGVGSFVDKAVNAFRIRKADKAA